MANEFIICGACGRKNIADRTTCHSCKASLIPTPTNSRGEQPTTDSLDIPLVTEAISFERASTISLTVASLLIGIAVFYYFVFFLPQNKKAELELQEQKEAAKIIQQQVKYEKEQLKEEQARQEVEGRLETNRKLLAICLTNARENYETNWASSCSAEFEKDFSAFLRCLNSKDQGIRMQCVQLWESRPRRSPNCSLPSEIAGRLNNEYKQQEYECRRKQLE